jgi:alcohol dehydrogenase
MKIRAAVLRKSGLPRPYTESLPLSIEEVDLAPPKAGEVLVQIKAAGLCHSDLVAIDGERARPTPMVIGHEAAGVIAELGPGVEGFAIGDHVVPSYVASCGTCAPCAEGRPALCEPATQANMAGTMLDGTIRLYKDSEAIYHHSGIAAFAEYAVVSEKALVKIDPSVRFDKAALFGCAVVTGVGSIFNTAAVKPGQSVAIIGLGGIGCCALLAAKACDASEIFAIDVNQSKLDFAKSLGVDKVVRADAPDVVETIRNMTGGGVDIAVEAAGAASALDLAYKITRRGGTTVVAGMPGPQAEVTLSHLSLAAEERVLRGSYMGSAVPSRDIPRYIQLFQDDKLPVDKLVTHYLSLDDINSGFERLAAGDALRQVVVF